MFVTPVYITSLFKSTTFNGRTSRSSYVVRRRTPFASSASRIVRQLRNQRPSCLRRTNLLSCSTIPLYPLSLFTSKLLCRRSLNLVPCYRDPFSLRLMDGARSGSPPPVSSALPQICHGPFQPHLEHNAPVFGACSCWPKKLDPLFPTPFVTSPYIFSL